jgi:hypothetical protein
LYQPNQHSSNRENQQNMEQAAKGGRCHHSEQPHYEKNSEYEPDHGINPLIRLSFSLDSVIQARHFLGSRLRSNATENKPED